MLLECIRERQMDVEVLVDMKRVKLEQCIHLLQFENEANQVSLFVWCWDLQFYVFFFSDVQHLGVYFDIFIYFLLALW